MNSSFEKCLVGSALLLMSFVVFSCNSKSDNKDNNTVNKEVVNDTIAEADSLADTLPNFADYDFVYFRGSKICFFSVANMDSVVYEGENDEIVNYEFKPGTLMLYYSVCKDSMMELKCIILRSRHMMIWVLTPCRQ